MADLTSWINDRLSEHSTLRGAINAIGGLAAMVVPLFWTPPPDMAGKLANMSATTASITLGLPPEIVAQISAVAADNALLGVQFLGGVMLAHGLALIFHKEKP